MNEKRPWQQRAFFYFLPVVAALVAFAALMVPLITRLFSPTLAVGQVAPRDILAPSEVTYVSQELTEQRRESAARSVAPVYTRSDTSVARQQLERLRNSLAYINSVRADEYATRQQKIADLTALSDVVLSQEMADNILGLSDTRWQTVQQEANSVLEQTMRTTIRPDRLQEARNEVAGRVSLFLPEDQIDIVSILAAAFVVPNSEYSESLTEASRQSAREAVSDVSRSFQVGERVVQRGQVLSAADVEALEQLQLLEPQPNWQDPVSAAGLVLLFTGFMVIYLRRQSSVAHDVRSLTMLVVLFLATLFSARLSIPGHTVIPYAFPIAAYSLIVAALVGPRTALVSTLPLGILAAYGLSNDLELTVYYLMGGLFGILALGRARRVTSFFWAGGAVAASGIVVILVYHLPQPTTDWIGLATLAGAAVFNGLASASLTIVLQFFLAQFLGLTTPMQLMELTRPDHPLMQLILREAPGTYQHSLQVANLAEQAAERIGANPLLTRVGALYHDVGKTRNPFYFIENQVPGFLNPHDDLEPASSSATIIAHVTDGLELGHKYRLPKRILEFISEHHGTMLTRYQYVKAVEAAGGDEEAVDEEIFRYPGPRPQSRETAILMLADGSEARVRAERPTTEDELRSIIKSVIENRISTSQLDDTDLTLKDLSTIQDSFFATLRGIYHPRVQYPTLAKDRAMSAAREAPRSVVLDATQDTPTVPTKSPPAGRQSNEVPLSSPADPSSAA